MSNDTTYFTRFADLFQGLDIAFGTGEGRWIKRPPNAQDWSDHLNGDGPGIGIAPLRQDSTVLFAAIDLDEPDFDAAREMQDYIPGPSFIESSRSGNAHVWCFFDKPIEAWLPMGVLKKAVEAATGGRQDVEVFPKNHDFGRVKLGNYINLPFHGDKRPVLLQGTDEPMTLSAFVEAAEASKNSYERWRRQSDWLMLSSPAEREETAEFGVQPNLHICASHVLSGAAGPVTEGHRSVVYFSLAKMMLNCTQYDYEETVEMLRSVNEQSAPYDIDDHELVRIIGNAARGRYTSTGCDDPLFLPYAHPDCRIAHPKA